MNNLENYIESFNMKYESFLTGCDALEEMGMWDTSKWGQMEGFYMSDMVSIILRLMGSDGKISEKEADYLNKTFGFEYSVEELAAVCEGCEGELENSFDENFENGISLLRQLNGKLADAYKELLALICRIIIESDGVVSALEIAEVKRLQALCEE